MVNAACGIGTAFNGVGVDVGVLLDSRPGHEALTSGAGGPSDRTMLPVRRAPAAVAASLTDFGVQ
jgi:hypothetical protein